MLQVNSAHRLATLEAALHHAAHRRGAGILFVNHLGNMLADKGFRTQDFVVFSVSLPDLYAQLLAADINFASFLPCRIAAFAAKGGLTLSAVSPREFCPIVGRPDLDWLAAELETALTGIMEEAARPSPARRPRRDCSTLESGRDRIAGEPERDRSSTHRCARHQSGRPRRHRST